MPRQTAQSIRFKIPAKYREVVEHLDFICPSCTSAGNGEMVYYKVKSSILQPFNGPGNEITRFGVICPECSCVAGDGYGIQNGICDLEHVNVKYKAPQRPKARQDAGFEFGEEEMEAPVIRMGKPKGPQKKVSELAPKTRGRKPKGAVKAAVQK